MSKHDEQILVVERKKLFHEETLTFQGIQTKEDDVSSILDVFSSDFEVMRRGDAEEDPTYKQPIPYVIVKRDDEVFLYKRLSNGGEARLYDQLSIGVGGHMNPLESIESFDALVHENLARELEEELVIEQNEARLEPIGLINDDINEVGKVHLGILYVLHVPSDANVEVREKDKLEGDWVTAAQLKAPEIYQNLESWSQYAVDILAMG